MAIKIIKMGTDPDVAIEKKLREKVFTIKHWRCGTVMEFGWDDIIVWSEYYGMTRVAVIQCPVCSAVRNMTLKPWQISKAELRVLSIMQGK